MRCPTSPQSDVDESEQQAGTAGGDADQAGEGGTCGFGAVA